MKRCLICLPLLTAILGLSVPLSLHAGIIPEHAGVDVQFGSSSGTNSASLTSAGSVIADDGTGHGPTLYTYSVAASARGTPGEYSWELKTRAFVSSAVTDVIGSGFTVGSKANWTDNLTLSGGNESLVTLFLNFRHTGYAELGSYDPDYNSVSSVYNVVGFSFDALPTRVWESGTAVHAPAHQSATFSASSTFDGQGYDGDGNFYGTGSLAMSFAMTPDESGVLSGMTRYTVFSNLWASTINGFASGNYYGTTVLTSITLADGSTPESRGYSLSFDSGLRSPNLAPTTVTPEPTSLALAGFAGLGMAVGAWRRRRQAA